MKKFFLFALLPLIVAGCKKNQEPEHNCNCVTALPDYISFGRAYGECGGDCAHFYLFKDFALYADDMSQYNGTASFSTTPLASEQLTKALSAVTALPRNATYGDTTFGCPDCHDQGGLHVSFRIKAGDPMTTWHADTDSTKQPAALRPFFRKVTEVLNQLP